MNVVWPKASALTSAALATAEGELKNGRADASSVVIAITDGTPMNKRKTFQAAKSLREKSRLMWVPISAEAPIDDVKHWASHPIADNVIDVPKIEHLATPKTINRIIA